VTTDTEEVSAIQKSADMFGKGFIRLCLWRKCKITWGSLRRYYTQSSSACVNILAMFNVYQGCSGVKTRYHTFLHPVALLEYLDYIKNMAAISQMCQRHADSHC